MKSLKKYVSELTLKSGFKFYMLVVIAVTLVFIHQYSHASEMVSVPAEAAPPAWLEPVVLFISALPYVGPYVLLAIKWMGFISAVMTILATAAQAILTIPEVMARYVGAQKMADRIKAVADVVLPVLKYLSMFNLQKKK